MSYNLATIRANLKTILGNVTQIQNVYEYAEPEIAGYPAIIFDIVEKDDEWKTNTEVLRTINFRVWVVTEVTVAGLDTATDILDTATQNVVEALEDADNQTLSGVVDWIMPTVGSRSQIQGPSGNLLSQTLDVRVKVLSSIL